MGDKFVLLQNELSIIKEKRNMKGVKALSKKLAGINALFDLLYGAFFKS